MGVGVSVGVARANAMLSWRWIPIKGARKVAACMVVQGSEDVLMELSSWW